MNLKDFFFTVGLGLIGGGLVAFDWRVAAVVVGLFCLGCALYAQFRGGD